MKIKCDCDRKLVCGTLGECFVKKKEVVELPPYLKQEIKKAISIKAALQVLKYTNHEQNKRTRIYRQAKRNNVRTNRPM